MSPRRVLAGVEREPGEQAPGAAARGRFDRPSADLDRQLTEEPDAHHRKPDGTRPGAVTWD
jgi:hypothetical protein